MLKALFNRIFRRKEAEVLIEDMEFHKGTWEAAIKTPYTQFIAEATANFFQESGGTNFVTMDFIDFRSMRGYTITIKPHDRKLPEKIAREYEAALQSIAANPENSQVIAIEVLKKFDRWETKVKE